MKYFVCALSGPDSSTGNCLLGIPSESTERIITAGRSQTAIYETENGETFISIPALLKLKDRSAYHGLILKSSCEKAQQKTLLLPRIDVELEIPEEEIQKLPETLAQMFDYFRGVYFNQNMILLLDPKKLLEHVK